MKKTFIFLIFIGISSVYAQKTAFKIFTKEGKESSYNALIEVAKSADIVMFGELHDDAIIHWLEFEFAKDMQKQSGKPIILGAEMFEADNQVILNEYLQDLIKEKSFINDARLWPNYKTDYQPIVAFAKESKIPFIATNIPRRYASMVNSGGFEALEKLSIDAKQWIAPLPPKYNPELPGYKKIKESMGQMPGGMGHGKSPDNLVKAQAIKDATMAYFILKNHKSGSIFIHYNGCYHSDDYEGIVWYLKSENPSLKILTISPSRQDNIEKLEDEYINKADFIIAVPSSMTKTQ